MPASDARESMEVQQPIHVVLKDQAAHRLMSYTAPASVQSSANGGSTMWYHLAAVFTLITTFHHVSAGPYGAQYADQPTLTLPWGTYVASPLDDSNKVAVFKNVRFGQAPIGELRFGKSKFPEKVKNNAEIQDSKIGPICVQAGTDDPVTGQPTPPKSEESEDCLFADIYVPYKAFKEKDYPLPVVNYIYGGAYYFGYKDTTVELKNSKTFNLYNGKGLLNASDNDFIWVVGNYRVGALGWLAGDTMEKQGTPNAGLHDQRLLLEFIQEHIEKVGGDKDNVAVWGNSAGAGSILHHLTSSKARDTQLFNRVALWSPAYQWFYDRNGSLEKTFQDFAAAAGCGKTPTVACLRGKDVTTDKIREANQAIVSKSLEAGRFPFGPALDGSYITRLPGAVFSYGEFTGLQSILVSHVRDEAGLFLPKLSWIKTSEDFSKFLNQTFTGKGDAVDEIREAITDTYPVDDKDDSALAQQLRVRRIVSDSVFVCNARWALDAYQYTRANYLLQYHFPPGLHGSDLLPLTWNKDVDTGEIIDILLKFLPEPLRRQIEAHLKGFSATYQRYFAGYASFGSPNALIEENDQFWPPVKKEFGALYKDALKVGLDKDLKPSFSLDIDPLVSNNICGLWSNIASYIENGESVSESARDFTRLQVQS